jgi:hypothetical protein
MNIYKKRRVIHAPGDRRYSLCENISVPGAKQTTDPITCPDCLALIQDIPLELARQTLAHFRRIYPPDIPMLCNPDSPDSGPRLTHAVQKALSEFVEAWESAHSTPRPHVHNRNEGVGIETFRNTEKFESAG